MTVKAFYGCEWVWGPHNTSTQNSHRCGISEKQNVRRWSVRFMYLLSTVLNVSFVYVYL